MTAEYDPSFSVTPPETHTFTFTDYDGIEVLAHRRKNPDGTIGGWVAATAIVDPSAIVTPGGLVWPGAEIGPNEVVRTARFREGVSRPAP